MCVTLVTGWSEGDRMLPSPGNGAGFQRAATAAIHGCDSTSPPRGDLPSVHRIVHTSTVYRPLSIIHRQVYCSSSIVYPSVHRPRLVSTVHRPPSTVHRPLSTIHRPPSTSASVVSSTAAVVPPSTDRLPARAALGLFVAGAGLLNTNSRRTEEFGAGGFLLVVLSSVCSRAWEVSRARLPLAVMNKLCAAGVGS